MPYITVICKNCEFKAMQTKLTFEAGKILSCPVCSTDEANVLMERSERGPYGTRRALKSKILHFMKQHIGEEFTPKDVMENIHDYKETPEVVHRTMIQMARADSKRPSLISLKRNHFTLLCEASKQKSDEYKKKALEFLQANQGTPFAAVQVSTAIECPDDVQYIARALAELKKEVPQVKFHNKDKAGVPSWSWFQVQES